MKQENGYVEIIFFLVLILYIFSV